jgi:hypothetical protein
MATFYKPITTADDIATTKTLLHEAIPLTGTILSGTYSEANIKTYTHGMFQSVFDYPYLSSSANHILDLSCGFSSNSVLSGATGATEINKKINIYNQFSQILVGYDVTGTLMQFDKSGSAASGVKMKEVFIVPFSRLLVKDEIKKGSFAITLGISASYASPFGTTSTIGDYQATSSYYANSPAGEYGLLFVSGALTEPVGHVYYQAGVALLTASVFTATANNFSGSVNVTGTMASASINTVSNSFRRRIQNIQFNNTTELNSTIYFCRANHNEFNYSSNPTYLEDSQIVVKQYSTSSPVAYVTTVGLYDDKDQLVAVAKLSEPLRKDPSTELTVRVRLDY